MSDLKPNNCKIKFECTLENKDCAYNSLEICKYAEYKNGPYKCSSVIAQVNAMVVELKKTGLRFEQILKSAGK